MATNKGTATWNGLLKEGSGTVSTQSGALDGSYSFASRFGDDNSWTNPEELTAAAHAACFSMFLASLLEKDKHKPDAITTTATFQLSKDDTGPYISKIHLETEGRVTGVSQEEFEKYAAKASKDCPMSRALNAVGDISFTATLQPYPAVH